jgi:hypothetical protein
LADRERAMEGRARALAEEAIESGAGWVQRLGPAPESRAARSRWLGEISTIAAYRDRWHISDDGLDGDNGHVASAEQMSDRRRAVAAAERAAAICQRARVNAAGLVWEPPTVVSQGPEL